MPNIYYSRNSVQRQTIGMERRLLLFMNDNYDNNS